MKPESETAERPRFQLRSIEQSPQPTTSSNLATAPAATSPWSRSENATPSNSNPFNTPAPNTPAPSSNGSDLNSEPKELELKLNTDALRPIPAPSNFDASPDWKPALLNARDQTAQSSNLVPVTDRSPKRSHEVQFLQSIRPASAPTRIESTNAPRAEIRPAGK